MEGSLESVLKKTYQTKWREIYKDCLGFSFTQRVAEDLQATLSIQDCDSQATEAIRSFVSQAAEVCFLMAISDPPLTMDLGAIG